MTNDDFTERRKRLADVLASFDQMRDEIEAKDEELANQKVMIRAATVEIEGQRTIIARLEGLLNAATETNSAAQEALRTNHQREISDLHRRFENDIESAVANRDSEIASLKAERDSLQASESQLLSTVEAMKLLGDGFNVRARPNSGKRQVDKRKHTLLEGHAANGGLTEENDQVLP